MPVAQSDLTPAELAAVKTAMMDIFARVGKPQYDSSGDDDGVVRPAVAGTVRASRGGAPWVNFGDVYWYRMMDTAETRCVLDADGKPLGVADRGPLVLTYVGPHAIVAPVNTGWNLEREIIWE